MKQFFPSPFLKNVSRETISRLEVYKTLLETWQRKINLVCSSTLPHLWERHFEDSLQLLSFLPEEKSTLVDLGSGAGFPGLGTSGGRSGITALGYRRLTQLCHQRATPRPSLRETRLVDA